MSAVLLTDSQALLWLGEYHKRTGDFNLAGFYFKELKLFPEFDFIELPTEEI